MRDTLINCDRASDISDTTTQDSHEDERDPDAVEERFRVDRRILEQMLQGPEDEITEAATFFQKIMEDTETLITWPSKLKIGAKSKKDPHIKVIGKAEAVRNAKEKVMSVLDTKSSRITLKMDVPFTDHSHIIGKGGNNIKSVMMETGCHIHFPDSNRNNPTEKSNQVSIAGQPVGVEKARARIREFLPLVFSFEIPVTGLFQPVPDPASPTVQQIQHLYNVTVQFRQRPRVYVTTVIIRGNETDAKQVKEGAQVLMDYLTGTAGIQVPVTMTMEVAAQHHPTVMGRNNVNLNLIMQQTATTVTFPLQAQSAPGIQPRKSTVTIHGSIDGVYLARQKIIGCLPLVLMFDMKDDCDVDPTFVGQLMDKFDVFISIKPKPKQPSRSVIVKGVERNASNLYETRRRLLGFECLELPVPVTIPSTYSLSSAVPIEFENNSDYGTMPLNGLGLLGPSVLTVNTTSTFYHSPVTSPNMQSPDNWNTGYQNGATNHATLLPPGFNHHTLPSDGLLSILHSHQVAPSQDKAPSVCSSTTSTLSSPNPSPRQGSPVEMPNSDSDQEFSMAASSLNRLQGLLDRHNLDDAGSSLMRQYRTAQAAVCDRLGLDHLPPFPADYDQKKLLATKAMKLLPAGPESRVPTNSWSGYGFSRSMPECVSKEKLGVRNQALKAASGSKLENIKEDVDKDPWKNSRATLTSNGLHRRRLDLNLSCSNYIDSVPIPRTSSTKHNDLTDLLNKMGLGKYTDLFQQQEIDLSTFLTMTDQDLKDLGISTFGARRKMLLAISDLSKQSFCAAPGAERSTGLSTSSASATCW